VWEMTSDGFETLKKNKNKMFYFIKKQV